MNPPQHIQIPIRYRPHLRRILFLLLLGLLLIYPANLVRVALGRPFFDLIWILPIPLLLPLVLACAWSTKRLGAQLAETDLCEVQDWIPEVMNDRLTAELIYTVPVFHRGGIFGQYGAALLERAGAGHFWELHQHGSETAPLEPPAHPIQPVLLGPHLQSLEAPELANQTRSAAVTRADMVTSFYGKNRWFRPFMAVVLSAGGLCMAYLLYAGLRHPSVSSLSLPLLLLVVGFGPGLLMRLPRRLYPMEWLLLNRGLLVRRSSWASPSWELTLFTPENSVLVYWRNLNTIAACHVDGLQFVRLIAPHQAALLSQAWRSSLPAPSLEQLSDWQ